MLILLVIIVSASFLSAIDLVFDLVSILPKHATMEFYYSTFQLAGNSDLPHIFSGTHRERDRLP
jgi:hypothetical protein